MSSADWFNDDDNDFYCPPYETSPPPPTPRDTKVRFDLEYEPAKKDVRVSCGISDIIVVSLSGKVLDSEVKSILKKKTSSVIDPALLGNPVLDPALLGNSVLDPALLGNPVIDPALLGNPVIVKSSRVKPDLYLDTNFVFLSTPVSKNVYTMGYVMYTGQNPKNEIFCIISPSRVL